jgi:hypothetical protein
LAEDLQDQRKFFNGCCKKDLVYKGLNVKYFIRFLMAMKKKEDGKFLSFTDLLKYKDEIMGAASMAEERLPTTFYEEIKKLLKGYKKELVKARRDGNTDEHAASIPCIANMVSQEQQYFVRFWTLAQWNFMARCASVHPLGFHNFLLGADSLICKYDNLKAVKKNWEKLSEKNTNANPENYLLCFWTGLGIWCALNVDNLSGSEKLFLSPAA